MVLKTSISEEALQRCAAREMMSAVQELRKTSGLVLKDVVDIFMYCWDSNWLHRMVVQRNGQCHNVHTSWCCEQIYHCFVECNDMG